MGNILMWGGVSLLFVGLIWLMGRFIHQPARPELYDGYVQPKLPSSEKPPRDLLWDTEPELEPHPDFVVVPTVSGL